MQPEPNLRNDYQPDEELAILKWQLGAEWQPLYHHLAKHIQAVPCQQRATVVAGYIEPYELSAFSHQ